MIYKCPCGHVFDTACDERIELYNRKGEKIGIACPKCNREVRIKK